MAGTSPKTRMYGDWDKARITLSKLNELIEHNLDRATKDIADDMKDDLKARIMGRKFRLKKLSPLTIGRKGHDTALYDKGELVEAIEDIRLGKLRYMVGISPDAISSTGEKLADIAKAMEFGVERIRPKSAKVLAIPITAEAQYYVLQFGSVGAIPGLYRRKGSKFLYIKGQSEPLFVLKKSVSIPARPVFGKTFNRWKRDIISRWHKAIDLAVHNKTYTGLR